METLRIATPYGRYYSVNKRGEIYYDGLKPSGGWLLLGIEHVKRNEFIPFADIAEWMRHNPTLLYKNGNPQYTIRDRDHGTLRTWGNTKYHGIRAIWVISKKVAA
jgi:hypothetical protein